MRTRRSSQQVDIVDDCPPLDEHNSPVASQPERNEAELVDAIDNCLPLGERYSQVSSRPDAAPIDKAHLVDNIVDCPPLGERHSQVASWDRTSCEDVVSEAEDALKASLSWKPSSKKEHPLDAFLARKRGDGHAKGWLRMALWDGKASSHLTLAQKCYITYCRSLFSGTQVIASMEKLAYAFGVNQSTMRTIACFASPSPDQPPTTRTLQPP